MEKRKRFILFVLIAISCMSLLTDPELDVLVDRHVSIYHFQSQLCIVRYIV